MTWTKNDLKKLKNKGYKVNDNYISNCGEIALIKPKQKIIKVSIEKNTIEMFLNFAVEEKLIDSFVTEHKFLEDRKFRFDWAIPSLKIGIEYEGLIAEKSRHTTINGFTTDCKKYNLAVLGNWCVIRYTALNYKDFYTDLEKIVNNKKTSKINT